jgi:hypothetical protein
VVLHQVVADSYQQYPLVDVTYVHMLVVVDEIVSVFASLVLPVVVHLL